MFIDRQDAATQLAARLARYRGQHPLILAIPRGGVPMGRLIADALDGELDVMLVHKLGAPDNPELAVGAIDENGRIALNEVAGWYGLEEADMAAEAQRQLAVLKERRTRYHRPPAAPRGRITIVVDDGVATGATLMAALRSLREQGPERLIAAIGVASPDTAKLLEKAVDELICLQTPEPFFAVGAHYNDFAPVSDQAASAYLEGRSP